MKKNIIITLISLIIGLSSMAKPAIDDKMEIKRINKELNEGKAINEINVKVREERDVWHDMHHMANTMIIAADGKVWGKKPMTQENINKLYVEVYNSHYPSRDYLLKILEKWRKGDFSEIDKDHNFVWHLLGGTVGWAESPKPEYIKKDK